MDELINPIQSESFSLHIQHYEELILVALLRITKIKHHQWGM